MPARQRDVPATAFVVIHVTPTVAGRIAQVAQDNCLTRGAFIRDCIEDFLAEDEELESRPIRSDMSTDPLSRRLPVFRGRIAAPPERATVIVTIALTPEVRLAAACMASRSGQTLTAIVQAAVNRAAADSGNDPPWTPAARDRSAEQRQAWRTRKLTYGTSGRGRLVSSPPG